jgi:ribonuclease P protein component
VNTFPKTKRLVQASDFKFVFDQANKIKSPSFLVLHKPGLTLESRLGLAISKKKIAKAHDRNRIKRIVRESFRQQHLPAVDVVVIAHFGGELQENAVLFRQLGKIWLKLTQYYAI